jgi:uncharacterized LabA/DUF88 family protein
MASLQNIQSRRKAVANVGQKDKTNYAFIDAQNLNLGVRELGWKLDFKQFRRYLNNKYKVSKAYLFIGYIGENQKLYTALQDYGYILIFKPMLESEKGILKGNVDADLVLHTMIEYSNYDKALIVSSDGDFYSLVEYLYDKNKLYRVLAPSRAKCSVLLKFKAKERIEFFDSLKGKLAYVKNKKHR